MITAAIDSLGYNPQIDGDGDIFVYYQMKSIYFMTGQEEEKYVAIILPQFAEVKDGEEALTLAVCNKMVREIKLTKVYIDQTLKNVSASCEFFYTDEECLKKSIDQSLNILGVMRSTFQKTKAEFKKC